jgi:hypothetical protein
MGELTAIMESNGQSGGRVSILRQPNKQKSTEKH